MTEILNTNILPLISQILNFSDMGREEVRLMKLEAIWILTNLAYGTKEDINHLMAPDFHILESVDLILRTSDVPMLEQILWFIGNLTGESSEYQEMMVNKTCILEIFKSLIAQRRIARSLLKTMCWVNSNIGRFKELNFD